jgi:hypothetical protein
MSTGLAVEQCSGCRAVLWRPGLLERETHRPEGGVDMTVVGLFSDSPRASSADILTSRHSLDTPPKRRDLRGLGVVSLRHT